MARSTSRCGTAMPSRRASASATSTVAVMKLIVEPLGRWV